MQEIVVIDGEIELENTLDGEVELETITDLDPEVVLSAGGGVTPSGTIEITENGTYNVTEYASADVDVQGGITPTGTKQINIASNGTTTEDVTNYASAEINVNVPASAVDTGTKNINSNGTHDVVGYANASVNVPNSYSAGDEGKVVSNGALVAQTSDTVTQNGTVDTTLINSLTVNVSGGASGGLANMVDITNAELSMPYMLSAMKNGNTVGGTVTYANNFTQTESLLLSTGLTTLHGLMMVGTSFDNITSIEAGQSNKWFMLQVYTDASSNTKYLTVGLQQTNTESYLRVNRSFGTAYSQPPEHGTLRVSGGDVYYASRYNNNNNYQIVRSGVQYEWLAW